MLTRLNRDFSFTEALNLFLIGGVIKGAGEHMEKDFCIENINSLLDSSDLDVQAMLDGMQDKVFENVLKNSQREPTP